MRKDKKDISAFNLDTKSIEYITDIADQHYDGNRSMALRFIIAEHEYLSARYIALGKSQAPREYHGEGVA